MQDMMNNKQYQEARNKLIQELRRGTLVLAVLSRLDQERYGYDLISRLGDHGLEIEQGTLYPLLRRLEEQGLLTSEWNVEGSRPRRYYQISPDGQQLLEELTVEWKELSIIIQKLLDD